MDSEKQGTENLGALHGYAELKLIQRFTCTRCGFVRELPHGKFAGMNAEIDCRNCNSLAFGLIRREVVSA